MITAHYSCIRRQALNTECTHSKTPTSVPSVCSARLTESPSALLAPRGCDLLASERTPGAGVGAPSALSGWLGWRAHVMYGMMGVRNSLTLQYSNVASVSGPHLQLHLLPHVLHKLPLQCCLLAGRCPGQPFIAVHSPQHQERWCQHTHTQEPRQLCEHTTSHCSSHHQAQSTH